MFFLKELEIFFYEVVEFYIDYLQTAFFSLFYYAYSSLISRQEVDHSLDGNSLS